jgi:DNA ligase D-like protein (predicted ligase)
MLAVLTDDRFSDPGWLYERKLDGVRAIGSRDRGGAIVWSRNHKSMNASYPELADALAKNGPKRFVVDGEIVAFDGTQTSFAALQPRIHLVDPDRVRASDVQVFYYLFDVLHLDGKDLTELPLRQRKQRLRDGFDFTDPLRFSQHRAENGEDYYRLACERGWEGVIAKRADAPYHHGRSADWLKFKCVRDQEFVVGGFTDPKGARSGFGALLVGYYDGDELRYAGKVGTGYSQAVLDDLRSTMDGLTQQDSPFADRVREPTAHWLRPELIVEVGFTEWTTDGKLRHPRFTGVRTDKKATEVVREGA